MTHPYWIGLDIGGANLKLADTMGLAKSCAFAMWQQPQRLGATLREFADVAGDARVAVTMTGELCDCFVSKEQGVLHIVREVESAFSGHQTWYYSVKGAWVTAEGAASEWRHLAASNWHALATCVAKYLPNESGILIDIGSTTTDIIPIRNGQPCGLGLSDWTRLQAGELIYSGVSRTPVGGVLPIFEVPAAQRRWQGTRVPLAQEYFASMLDVFLVSGDVKPLGDHWHTADGRPADVPNARTRLARMFCADACEIEPSLIDELVLQAAASQATLISKGLAQVSQRHPDLASHFLVSGEGDWLAARIVLGEFPNASIIRLADRLSTSAARAAPAWAVAQLAAMAFDGIGMNRHVQAAR